MEFTTPVTERDFLRAYSLNASSGYRTFSSALIYFAAAFFTLIILGTWLYASTHPDSTGGQFAAASTSVLLPPAILLILWIVVFRILVPAHLRKRYRALHLAGVDVHYHLTPDGLQIRPSDQAFDFTPWSAFRFWRESPDMFLVGARGGKYCFLPKGTLSTDQQSEIRGMLTPVLKKK